MCRLAAIAGRELRCAQAGCPFWEPGGAVLEGRCVFERMNLAACPALAADLIDIREQLDAAARDARVGSLSELAG
jgi:hypothetical protein